MHRGSSGGLRCTLTGFDTDVWICSDGTSDSNALRLYSKTLMFDLLFVLFHPNAERRRLTLNEHLKIGTGTNLRF